MMPKEPLPSTFSTREFRIADFSEALAVWRMVEGVEVAEGDSEGELKRYLLRNPGLSRVAVKGEAIIGAVLCGHDGRRGFIIWRSIQPIKERESASACFRSAWADCAVLASRGPSFWFRERMQKGDHSGCGMVGKLSREQTLWD